MWCSSLRGMKHMTMEHRIEWLAWAATAIGSLGLVGLASAQTAPPASWTDALAMGTTAPVAEGPVVSPAVVLRDGTISDDGWSADLPAARQLVVARKGANAGPVVIELLNERGDVVDHIDWMAAPGALRPVVLDALAAGRYVVRVASSEQSTVMRFRKD